MNLRTKSVTLMTSVKDYRIEDTNDIIYIGNDLPNEYTGSVYTYKLKGAAAKAKANAAQGLPEMLKIAVGRRFRKKQRKTLQKCSFRLVSL